MVIFSAGLINGRLGQSVLQFRHLFGRRWVLSRKPRDAVFTGNEKEMALPETSQDEHCDATIMLLCGAVAIFGASLDVRVYRSGTVLILCGALLRQAVEK
jgi:hypothetical protein